MSPLLTRVQHLLRALARRAAHIAVFLLASPLLLIAAFSAVSLRRRPRSRTVLFAGLEHVIEKTLVRGRYWEGLGYESRYYSFESTRWVGTIDVPRLTQASEWLWPDAYRFARLLSRHLPAVVEIYYRGAFETGLHQLAYVVLCAISRTFSVVVLRGELYDFDTFSPLQRLAYRLTLRWAGLVLYREQYMLELLKKLGVDHDRVMFDPNKVPVRPLPERAPSREVLYLNSFKKWRRVELLVKAVPMVARACPDLVVTIVGAQEDSETAGLKRLIDANLFDKHVRVYRWTDQPQQYYARAGIFVLMADLVYLNFSLLEAMERGLVPIIAQVADAEKIVTDGVDGFIRRQDETELANALIHLLQNPDTLARMSIQTRRKIETCFDDKDRILPIRKALEQYYR